jgi:hypothetical protein
MDVIKNAFNDVEQGLLPVKPDGSIAGLSYLDNLQALQVGFGTQGMRVDQSGLWLGAKKFADAPFSVNMAGHIIASSADFSAAGYSKINIFRQAAIPTSISIGDLWFDSDDGDKMYRAGSVGANEITTGEWELVSTPGITVFAQDAIPTSLAEGDLWYDTNDNNKPYRAASVGADQITAGEWELVNDLRAADALLKAGSSQTLTGNFNLNDANVLIDGANKRILINDGTNNRIVIGNV